MSTSRRTDWLERRHQSVDVDARVYLDVRDLHLRCARSTPRVVAGASIFKLVKYLAREYLLIFATCRSRRRLPRLGSPR